MEDGKARAIEDVETEDAATSTTSRRRRKRSYKKNVDTTRVD